MEKMINLKVDNILVSVPEGSTILDAAKKAGIEIPTLCFLRKINAIGACRICLVEVKNLRPLVAACVYPVSEGMEVLTHSKRINQTRKTNLELILSAHNKNCLSCPKSLNCKLQELSKRYGCNEHQYEGEMPKEIIDASSPSIIRNTAKCILCKRCKAVCYETQSVSIINTNKRGFESYIGCAFGKKINETACVGCGQCTLVCPTGALMVNDDTQKVVNALNDPNLITVVAPAPSVRVGLAEEFNHPVGTNCEGLMYSALRTLGFQHIFDINFGADLTIVEEANELVERIKHNKGPLPMLTSCSPGWINFVTAYYPEFIPNLSTTKSPQQIFGAALKSYWADKMQIDPNKIFFVTIMPCTAKKMEITMHKGVSAQDIDATISVRELANLLKRQGIDLNKLEPSKPDDLLSEYSGAGLIFGATGGVMEAAIRTAVDTLTKTEFKKLDYKKVRGTKGIKEATVKIGDLTLNVCATSGLANARKVLEDVKSGKKQYHFIEVMACPGGCVNGGGMPLHDLSKISFEDRAKIRAKNLYKGDHKLKLRKSHENPSIIKMYKDYYGHYGSHKAHECFHTSFKQRKFI